MSATQTLESTPSSAFEPAKASERLLCLDVFRGLAVAGMILVDNPGSDDLAYGPIKHADWNGWTCADFIFPSFLFLVGISMVFSFAARLQRGESRSQILFHAFKRSLILIAIGLFVNASPSVLRCAISRRRFLFCGQAGAGRSLPCAHAWSATGPCCVSPQFPVSEGRDTTSPSWILIATLSRGSTANCSWVICLTEPAIQRESSARFRRLAPP